MRCQRDLYHLIKSMTKAEKRQFKLFATQHARKDSNNYVLLFDAVDRQEVYDEEKLRRKLRKYNFSKSLAKTKYLLYELILRMLRQLYDGRTTVSKIQGLLEASEVLRSKGLYQQSMVSLQKAKKLCLTFEASQWYLRVLDQEKLLIGYLNQNNVARSMRNWLDSYREKSSSFAAEQQLEQLLMQSRILFEVSRNYQMDELAFNFKSILSDPLLDKARQPSTFLGQAYYLEIYALRAQTLHDVPAAARCYDELFDLWQAHAEYAEFYRDAFIRLNTSYLSYCAATRQSGPHYATALKNIQRVAVAQPEERHRYMLLSYSHDFICHLAMERIECCRMRFLAVNDYLNAGHGRLLDQSTLLNLYFHLGVFHFIDGEYDEAQAMIRQIMAIDKKCDYPNIQNFCRLIGLMIRYEEQEFDLLEYDIMTTHRFLAKHKQVQPIEKLVLNVVKKLIRVKHSREATNLFIDFYSQLQDLQKSWQEPLELTAGSAFYRWVRDKLPQHKNRVIN